MNGNTTTYKGHVKYNKIEMKCKEIRQNRKVGQENVTEYKGNT